MSDPNQPPYPGPEEPSAGPPPPAYPPPPPAYPAPPPNPYGQPQQGMPQYPPAYEQYQSPPPNPYAHWGLRVGAYLLDSILLIPVYIVAGIGSAMYEESTLTADTQNLGLGIMIIGYLLGAAFQIWNQIVRQGRTGSSLGKQWVGIAVISERDGMPIGGWRTFGRALLHILDALPCYLGFLWPLWDDKRQTFADKIMKTIVVKRAPTPPGYPQG